MTNMNIQELEDKHRLIWVEEGENPWKSSNNHTKLSVEFTIEVLEDLEKGRNFYQPIRDKIQELKKYLDNNISDDKQFKIKEFE